jgi:signal-transduction protein with cAMP-binding, CBS, and nucleotidyltransferase domain
MIQSVRDVMTVSPMSLSTTATAVGAARAMRDGDIGDVVVLDDRGNLYGIVTDRDLAVRVVAESRDPEDVTLGDICSKALVVLAPTDTVDEAVQLMRQQALRRLPVVDKGKPVGIVSLGDLAIQRDPSSVLADISAARGNT